MPPGTGATLDSIRILWELGVIGSLTDADLLDRFLADSGDASETAFAILVERHGPAVRRVCLDVLGDPHDAQDAAQAVFLVLARRAQSIRKPGALGSWLHGVALRVARRALAENARRREVERRAVRESAIHPAPTPCPELHEELDRLPEKYRAPIVLCYLEGQTQEQAARSLGWPLGTVQTRLHRGRQTLQGRLVRRGIVPAGLAAAGLSIPRAVAAPIAASWIRATARASAKFAARESLAELVPASVAALAQGVLTTLFRSTLKLAAVGFLAASLGVIGVSMAVRSGTMADTPQLLAQANPPKNKESKAETKTSPVEIRGVVVDEAGRPVAGAFVRGLIGYSETQATSAANGSFTLPFPVKYLTAARALIPFMLIAQADDGNRQGFVKAVLLGGRQSEPARIVMKAARELAVHVEDATGRPVPGAMVEVTERSPFATGTTQADGLVRFRLPSDADIQQVAAFKPGLGFDYFENYRSWPIPPATKLTTPGSVRLVLDGARPLRIRVVRSDGAPAPGVGLRLSFIEKPGKLSPFRGGSMLSRATSGADGIARFDWFPAKLGGRRFANLQIDSDEFHGDGRQILEPQISETSITVQVLRKTRVSGRVVDSEGKPVEGIEILASGHGSDHNSSRGDIFTQADGTYVLSLAPEQSYIVAVVALDRAAPSHTGILIKEGQPLTGVDFQLSRGTIIRGKVRTYDGKPAYGQNVSIAEEGAKLPFKRRINSSSPDHESLGRPTFTDADGRYEFRVGPGTFSITGPTNTRRAQGPSEPLIIKSQDVVERDFRLNPERSKQEFSGTIKGPDGRPVEGAVIAGSPARSPTRVDPFASATDGKGRFTLQRARATFLVYAHTVDNSLAGAAWVSATQKDVEITLDPSATLRGRVVDRQGKPQSGVLLNADWSVTPIDEGLQDKPASAHRTTDAQGRYAVEGLPVGASCEIAVLQEDGKWKQCLVDLEKPGTTEVKDVVLDAPARKLD